MKSCAKKCLANRAMVIFVLSLKNQNGFCGCRLSESWGQSIEFWITSARDRYGYRTVRGSERSTHKYCMSGAPKSRFTRSPLRAVLYQGLGIHDHHRQTTRG